MASARRSLVLVLALMASLIPIIGAAPALADTPVFVNEIHYDNAGTDEGEAIEVAGPAGTDLSGWEIVLYNGNGGAPYNTTALSGVIPDAGDGFGTVFVSYPSNGIQNGSPDGLALVNGGAVVQFLSYEGTFTAVGGPADGMTSTDIGVSEGSATPVGTSLQLGGTGTTYEDFTWQDSLPNTFGSPNTNQIFGDEPPPPAGSTTLVINEIDYDQPSTDTAEFIEIFNVSDGPIDLLGWELELVNGTGGGASIYDTIALPDVSLAAGEFFVVCADATATANCDLEDISSIQNGAPDAVAIRNGDALIDTVSYEGDTGDPYTEGSGVGLVDSPSGFFSISRFADGTDTDRNNVDLLSSVCSTPGEPNSDETTQCDPPVEVKIHEVQGPGDASPIEGARVIVEGVVVGDEETFDSLAGFFVQEEDYDVDTDPMTSEGVFVFNFSNDDVDLGDVVRVEGTVQERFGNTQLTDFVVVDVLEVEPRVATPTTIEFPIAAISNLEWVEGMAVNFPQKLVVTEYFNYDRFGEVVVALPSPGTDRPMQPTAVFAPGSPEGIALADVNARSRITIDDGQSSQNPDFNVHPIFRNEFGLDNAFRGGDQVTELGGPIYFAFGEHKLYPNAYKDFQQSVRNDDPPRVRGRLEVATLNALNYFLTLDDGVNDICGANQNLECRGADTEEEFERQRSKLLQALARLDADVVGLVELENTPGVSPLEDIVDGLNAMVGKKTYDYVDTGVVGEDAIKVGFIYKRKVVKPYKDFAVLDTDAFVDPNDTGSPKNRAALAVTFNEKGSGQRFSVVLNHFKSKGSGCGDGDDDEFAGSCNLTRTLAAEELMRWIDTDPTKSKDKDWMILGDLNSYDKEDPIVALQDGGYRDLIAKYNGEYAYTYVFSGQWGYLDYAMTNKALSRQVRSTKIWNLNSDEPDIFDYDTSFKSDSQIAMFEGDLPYRSSDHDAVIVGLNLRSAHHSW